MAEGPSEAQASSSGPPEALAAEPSSEAQAPSSASHTQGPSAKVPADGAAAARDGAVFDPVSAPETSQLPAGTPARQPCAPPAAPLGFGHCMELLAVPGARVQWPGALSAVMCLSWCCVAAEARPDAAAAVPATATAAVSGADAAMPALAPRGIPASHSDPTILELQGQLREAQEAVVRMERVVLNVSTASACGHRGWNPCCRSQTCTCLCSCQHAVTLSRLRPRSCLGQTLPGCALLVCPVCRPGPLPTKLLARSACLRFPRAQHLEHPLVALQVHALPTPAEECPSQPGKGMFLVPEPALKACFPWYAREA